MSLLKKIALFFLIFIGLIILSFVSYYIYLISFYYVASGPVDVDKIVLKAMEQRDPSICSKIKNPDPIKWNSEESLISECYYKIAHLLNDENICDSISISISATYRDSCISDIALVKNDYFLCEKINGQLNKGSCYNKFTQIGIDVSVCENVDDSNRGTELSGRDLCYIGSVKSREDITICDEKIKTLNYKDSCYTIIAREVKDPSICEKIQNSAYNDFAKRDCIEQSQKV
mgnify:CR=1 FL=1